MHQIRPFSHWPPLASENWGGGAWLYIHPNPLLRCGQLEMVEDTCGHLWTLEDTLKTLILSITDFSPSLDTFCRGWISPKMIFSRNNFLRTLEDSNEGHKKSTIYYHTTIETFRTNISHDLTSLGPSKVNFPPYRVPIKKGFYCPHFWGHLRTVTRVYGNPPYTTT